MDEKEIEQEENWRLSARRRTNGKEKAEEQVKGTLFYLYGKKVMLSRCHIHH